MTFFFFYRPSFFTLCFPATPAELGLFIIACYRSGTAQRTDCVEHNHHYDEPGMSTRPRSTLVAQRCATRFERLFSFKVSRGSDLFTEAAGDSSYVIIDIADPCQLTVNWAGSSRFRVKLSVNEPSRTRKNIWKFSYF